MLRRFARWILRSEVGKTDSERPETRHSTSPARAAVDSDDARGSPYALEARLSALESDVDGLRVEWADVIGKLSKLAAKLSVAHKRELDRATSEDGQLSLAPPAAAAPPMDRAARRAALRSKVARGAALLIVVGLAGWLDALRGHPPTAYDVAFLPILATGLKLLAGSSIGKSVVGAVGRKLLGSGVAQKLLGSGAGRAVQAGVMVATEAGAGKLARRVAKGAVAAVATGAAFEVGSRVVGKSAAAPAVFNPGTGVMAPGSGIEIAPGVESDGRGGLWIRTASGRRRRVSHWDALGNPVLRKPRMNPLNPRALGRANRRITSFATIAQRTLKHLAAQSRKFAPPSARGAKSCRPGHKAGCRCVACRAA